MNNEALRVKYSSKDQLGTETLALKCPQTIYFRIGEPSSNEAEVTKRCFLGENCICHPRDSSYETSQNWNSLTTRATMDINERVEW